MKTFSAGRFVDDLVVCRTGTADKAGLGKNVVVICTSFIQNGNQRVKLVNGWSENPSLAANFPLAGISSGPKIRTVIPVKNPERSPSNRFQYQPSILSL